MDAPYEDDASHPIPFVGNIDTQLNTNAGVCVGIVIASPLYNDTRSVQRLSKKIELYLEHLVRLRAEWDAAHEQTMKARLYLDIHPGSAPEIFETISHGRHYIEAASIEFKVSTKNDAFGIQ